MAPSSPPAPATSPRRKVPTRTTYAEAAIGPPPRTHRKRISGAGDCTGGAPGHRSLVHKRPTPLRSRRCSPRPPEAEERIYPGADGGTTASTSCSRWRLWPPAPASHGPSLGRRTSPAWRRWSVCWRHTRRPCGRGGARRHCWCATALWSTSWPTPRRPRASPGWTGWRPATIRCTSCTVTSPPRPSPPAGRWATPGRWPSPCSTSSSPPSTRRWGRAWSPSTTVVTCARWRTRPSTPSR